MNSRDKGRRGEIELCKILATHWPQAVRNLDQYGPDKRDALGLAGLHFQIKRVEKLNIWKAMDQAVLEAANFDLPILAFRRNFTREPLPSRSRWFGAMELDELLPLLKLREA